jgi:hypothetical protein
MIAATATEHGLIIATAMCDFEQFPVPLLIRPKLNTASPHTISGFSPSAVRSITSRSAKDELILVTCGMADSHSL